MEMCEYLYPQHFRLCEKKKQTDKQRNTHKIENRLSRQAGGGEGGANIFCWWSGCLLEMSENLSSLVHSFHLCGKINRQTKKQTFEFSLWTPAGGIFARGADII